MLGKSYYKFDTIRKMIVTFGTLFNDIEVVRVNNEGVEKERLVVPISFGPKERYITRLMSDPNLTKAIAISVPRMSFNLEGMEYDPSRKQITMIKNRAIKADEIHSQYVPVPYNYQFSLSIIVRNIEDGTQIIEQILPFFTPDFTVTVNFISEMAHTYDVPIILNDVKTSADYEGEFSSSTTRLVTWDLSFTAKGYVWPPVHGLNGDTTGWITKAISNIYTNDTGNPTTVMFSEIVPEDAKPNGVYEIVDTIIEY